MWSVEEGLIHNPLHPLLRGETFHGDGVVVPILTGDTKGILCCREVGFFPFCGQERRFHDKSLDRTLSAHYTVYFERSFRPEWLQDIPRYLVYRLHAFGTPITSVANSSSTSGDSSPLPSATEE